MTPMEKGTVSQTPVQDVSGKVNSGSEVEVGSKIIAALIKELELSESPGDRESLDSSWTDWNRWNHWGARG